jgi:uncharacterized membrane protein
MVTSNKILMTQAREALAGRWGLAVGTFFLYFLIVIALSAMDFAVNYIGTVALFLVIGAFSLGLATFCLSIARKEDAKLEMLFSGFKFFGKAVGLYLLITLFTLLWMLLLIIPGFIAAISYGLAFYLMSDNPNIGVMEAINKSKKMMYGYKWKYFCLGLRFFGWILLGILTLGIGLLWIIPYLNVSFAKFYEDVKANYVEVQ